MGAAGCIGQGASLPAHQTRHRPAWQKLRLPGQSNRTMNPTALITGASRGIGRAIALALANENYNCIINFARNEQAAIDVQSQVESLGAKAQRIQADIASTDDRQRLVDETLKAFGRIDLLINNA